MSHGTRATRTLFVLALSTAAFLLAACRSDGGVGRRDSLRGMRWTLDTLSWRHDLDVKTTRRNFDELAAWCEREVTHPTQAMERTMDMYLEGHTGR